MVKLSELPMKPVVLVQKDWGHHIALEVEMEKADSKIIREIHQLNKVTSSATLSALFLLLVRSGNFSSPSALSERLGKSKFVVSQELAKLRKVGLVEEVIGRAKAKNDDMRRRLYQVSTAKLIEIFRQDYSLELSLYQNHILFDGDANVEAGGVITSTELAIFGNRKLGVVREVRLERDLSSDKARQNASSRKNKLLSEFVFLFRAYLADRHFATIKEYYLGFYRELSMEYRKLPRKSELAAFYRFLDLSMSKIKPLDYLWEKYVRPNEEKGGLLLKLLGSVEQENSGAAIPLLLFTEAGKTDSTGQYILNGEARGFIRSGLKTRIYPSFTFSDSF